MMNVALDPRVIGQIAAEQFDTQTIDLATAETMVEHKLAVAVAGLVPPDGGETHGERILIHERRQRVMQMMGVLAVVRSVSRLLSERNIPYLLLKGPALAVQTTGNWAGRNSCDVDLLINPTDCVRVHEAFLEAGLRRREGRAAPAGGFYRWAMCEVGYHGTFANIDLHWRLDPSPATYAASFGELRLRSETVEIEGSAYPTLGRLDAWLFTAVHGARSDWCHWSMLLDAVRQFEQLTAAERAEAREFALREGCSVPLAIAEALVARCLSDRGFDGGLEDWAIARADRILRATSAGEGPQISIFAALARRIELARSSPSLGAAIDSLGRAVGRVIVHPWHYRDHLLLSLQISRKSID